MLHVQYDNVLVKKKKGLKKNQNTYTFYLII